RTGDSVRSTLTGNLFGNRPSSRPVRRPSTVCAAIATPKIRASGPIHEPRSVMRQEMISATNPSASSHGATRRARGPARYGLGRTLPPPARLIQALLLDRRVDLEIDIEAIGRELLFAVGLDRHRKLIALDAEAGRLHFAHDAEAAALGGGVPELGDPHIAGRLQDQEDEAAALGGLGGAPRRDGAGGGSRGGGAPKPP